MMNFKLFLERIFIADSQRYVFDPIRKKNLLLSPEEEVRQQMIDYLIIDKKYPKSLISLEKGLIYNKLQKRTDILVFNREHKPFLLVECKAPSVKIDETTLKQALTYNEILDASYVVLTNGKKTLCFRAFGALKAEQVTSIPDLA